ncbi:MAG: GNAT family N-acetyltransferase [Betaproteobacteria bacterium]
MALTDAVADHSLFFQPGLSTTAGWFRLWLEAFGNGSAGIWQDQSPGHPGIPYQRVAQRIGPFYLDAASGAANDHTPRYDILGELTDPAPVLTRMMESLDVSLLSFHYLSAGSKLLRAVQEKPGRLLHHLDICESAPYVDCTGNWDEYWASRGKSRTEWGRRERRLMDDQGARLACLSRWDEIAPVFDDILAIEASGWKGQQGSAIAQSPQTRKFYSEAAKSWAGEDRLRLFVLYLQGRPIAFELNALSGGVLNCVKHGYLESCAKMGPGQVLRIQVLRWAFAQPEIALFDMFGPATEAKLKWATGVEDLYTLRIFRRSPGGLLAWARHVAAPRLKATLASVARRK